jgi:post-segregation antitoxin (ccd killing protein)
LITNIDKNTAQENVHLHKQVLLLLKENLSYGYAAEARRRLLDMGEDVSATMIRQIKNGHTINWRVLEILTEMARENQERMATIAKLVND